MIRDEKNEFCVNQAITSTAASTDVLDWGETSPDRGTGKRLMAECVVTEAFAATGAATLTVAIQDSADNSTYADLVVTRAIAKTDLVKGYKFNLDLPEGKHKRYLRLNFTVANGPFTAGKLTAHLRAG